ncbi:MAG TPA: tetratricopeptide repeat protein [Candidatus Acidoferrales bacterium]|jgi:TolB-like protein/DNA-binding winged helix-turn-helix (wHTH) protein|nr:tetratricopeptide repeat protein [Candidatus Acidoferrales bacterium]
MAPESNARARIVRFGTFEADLAAGELRKGGAKIKVHGQPFEVLALLLGRPGEIVLREELRQKLWPTDTFVDFDHGVNTAINRLREALGDSAENPRYIETVPRRGYRFVAPVETLNAADSGTSGLPTGTPGSEEIPVGKQVAPRRYRGKAMVLAFAVIAGIALIVSLSRSAIRERLLGVRSTPRIQSLAVLPLVNISSDGDQDFFADGMTEELTTDLGKIGALRVISRTSAMQYKGTKKPLPEIARELNVDAVVEGTVARAGNHLRITANLLQTSPEKHLWGEKYESEVGDALTVQGQIAQAVAREIQVKLTPGEQKLLGNARPVNPKAHDDYLKGRYLCGKDTREGLDKGIQYFQQAIQEAPTEPLAYAGLADCYMVFGWAGDVFAGDLPPKEGMTNARDAARKALQLDGDLAEAHTSLAVAELILNWNWTGAEREFKRAIELNPNYSPAHVWYAHYLAAMGRFDESVAEARRSLELDPFSQFTMDFAEWALYLAHRYDLTLQQSQKSLELAPEFPWAHYDLGLVYLETGRINEAVQEFTKAEELFGMSQDSLGELRKAYHQSGEKGYWRKILEICQEQSKQPRKFASNSGYGWCDYIQNTDVAVVQVRLGEFDAAFESLERGYSKHEANLIYLKVDPKWDVVRSDPRFQDLISRVGIPP